MQLIESKGWSKERLLKLVKAIYNTIDHLEYNWCDGEQDEIALIGFRSDLCLGTMEETFVVCDTFNELPAEFTAKVNFKESTLQIL